MPPQHGVGGEDVGHDAVLAGVGRESVPLPTRSVQVLQPLDQAAVVDGVQDGVVVRRRRRVTGAPASSSAARITSARAAISVPSIVTPTQTSPLGS